MALAPRLEGGAGDGRRNYRIEVGARRDIEHTDANYLIDSHGDELAGMVFPFLPTWVSNDLEALAAEDDRRKRQPTPRGRA